MPHGQALDGRVRLAAGSRRPTESVNVVELRVPTHCGNLITVVAAQLHRTARVYIPSPLPYPYMQCPRIHVVAHGGARRLASLAATFHLPSTTAGVGQRPSFSASSCTANETPSQSHGSHDQAWQNQKWHPEHRYKHVTPVCPKQYAAVSRVHCGSVLLMMQPAPCSVIK